MRPGAQQFLEEMSKLFEIVIFTAAMQDVMRLFINSMQTVCSISWIPKNASHIVSIDSML